MQDTYFMHTSATFLDWVVEQSLPLFVSDEQNSCGMERQGSALHSTSLITGDCSGVTTCRLLDPVRNNSAWSR